MATKAQRHGAMDARVWMDETPRGEWDDAIRPGQLGADDGLINALGSEEVARLFGVRAYWRGEATRAFHAACAEYNAAWRSTVERAILAEKD